MRALLYVVESKHGPAANWQPWPGLAPFPHREDAILQQVHLASREPIPTRFASTVREYRVAERPAGCPRCIEGAIGPLCQWHRDKLALAEARGVALQDVPRPVSTPKPMQPSPRPRRSPRSGYGPEAREQLRRHNAGGAE